MTIGLVKCSQVAHRCKSMLDVCRSAIADDSSQKCELSYCPFQWLVSQGNSFVRRVWVWQHVVAVKWEVHLIFTSTLTYTVMTSNALSWDWVALDESWLVSRITCGQCSITVTVAMNWHCTKQIEMKVKKISVILCSAGSHETNMVFSTGTFLTPTVISIICTLNGITFRCLPEQMIETL